MTEPAVAVPVASLDRRLTLARVDLAAEELAGMVEAPRFAAGQMMRVVEAAVPLRREPRHDEPFDTHVLFGEEVVVYDEEEGWAWGQLVSDGYVGYLSANALSASVGAPTHRVRVPRTFVYPQAGMKMPPLMALPLNAQVNVVGQSGDYAQVHGSGFIFAAHLAECASAEKDFVGIAEAYIGVPYLWGGKTSLGLDCSGLVQISLAAADIFAPRDTDMMQQALGYAIDVGPELGGAQRGDVVFWKGHVGIMRDAETLLHASGHHMQVVSEPLREAASRIRAAGTEIACIRRLIEQTHFS